MCIICKSTLDQLNQLITLDCDGCTSLTSIPQLNQLTTLDCWGCTSLTSILQLNQLTTLYCSKCTSLTCIPQLNQLTTLYCWECTSLTFIPNNQYIYVNTVGCKWLDENNHKFLPVLQRFIKKNFQYWRFKRILKDKRFIEWLYQPNEIGGKFSKKQLSKFIASNINQVTNFNNNKA